MLPFLPYVLAAGQAMYQTMIRYSSLADNWGLVALLNRGKESPALGRIFLPMRLWWLTAGRYVILVAVVGVALLSRYRRKLPMTEQAAMGAALFLVLTPGFGVQYVVFALPLRSLVAVPGGDRVMALLPSFGQVQYNTTSCCLGISRLRLSKSSMGIRSAPGIV